ncbi:hypothetical protein CAMRE0001_2037 [Campylobacter rectus RM3267]|uniref:Uncharacterized protein n=1 Tax=Campylobacter rectus RM3267 TaxID=553218 RepID=B9D4I1_CAMRE|nr:hypothetical protein CAMRE0001_2037 [Campylobacter rectus RM3267]
MTLVTAIRASCKLDSVNLSGFGLRGCELNLREFELGLGH